MSTAEKKKVSTGRGGAGNIPKVAQAPSKSAVSSTKTTPSATPGNASTTDSSETTHLVTPHIKEKQYTTGRGGSGNIVNNEDPETARRAQDVETPPIRRDFKAGEAYHHGRGGEGNLIVTQLDGNQKQKTKDLKDEKGKTKEIESAADAIRVGARKKERTGSGLAEKGKEMFDRLRSKDRQRRNSESNGSESAVS